MNHLAGETSPYLRRCITHPVEWYPWGQDALARARDEDKPIFLSIGYSACHWCHVMERESFTDEETAALLNREFISVKVDREERPDLDAIYMQAVTTLTGRGGWPLSVWLTPDGAPFYGGTYFPPSPRFGMASFRQVLETIARVWRERRDELHRAAAELREHLDRESADLPGRTDAGPSILAEALGNLRRSFDTVNGGWGGAPKFPQPLVLEYLLAQHVLHPQPRLDVDIQLTLDAMAAGGIYDHLGGGFHRYSTDERWLVPHFEKMLYDNAQLARCYLHAWQHMSRPRYRRVAEETLDYLLSRMAHPQGGFFSAEDADSEGKEGAFYVWTIEEIREVISPAEADLTQTTYGLTREGNFEGTNVLHRTLASDSDEPALAAARAKLLAARDTRVHPARDEKILAAWNGLTLTAFADAARILPSERYLRAAVAAAEFVATELVREEDRLFHSWKDGRSAGNGFLDDYACMVEGLLAVYETTYEERWFALARGLADAMVRHFRRPEGGFFDTSDDHEALIVRPRSLQDSPTPCGNALAATALLKLAGYTGESGYLSQAEETLAAAGISIGRVPMMFGQWLSALLLAQSGLTEIAVVGDPITPETKALLSVIRTGLRPSAITAARLPGAATVIPLLEGREPSPGEATTAWVCHGSTCLPPTSDPSTLQALLEPEGGEKHGVDRTPLL